MRSVLLTVFCALILLSGAMMCANATSHWDAAADFTNGNPNGAWSYKYDHYWYYWYDLKDLNEYGFGAWTCPGNWETDAWIPTGEGNLYKPTVTAIDQTTLLLHSGNGYFDNGFGDGGYAQAPVKPVIQWKAPAAGLYQVHFSYTWNGYDETNCPTNEVRVAKNLISGRDWPTESVSYMFSANGSWNFDPVVNMNANDTLSFFGGYAPGDRMVQNGWWLRDVKLVVTIDKVTPPASFDYNAASDFGSSNPTGTWNYLYDHYWYDYNGVKPLENKDDPFTKWLSPGDWTNGWGVSVQDEPLCQPWITKTGNVLSMHPGAGYFYKGDGTFSDQYIVKPVLQWKAPTTGLYNVYALYTLMGNTASYVRVTKNYTYSEWNTPLLSQMCITKGFLGLFDHKVPMAAGDTIEFWGAFQPENRYGQDYWYDRDCTIDLKISKVPSAQWDAVRDFSSASNPTGTWAYKYIGMNSSFEVEQYPLADYGSMSDMTIGWYDFTKDLPSNNPPVYSAYVSDLAFPGAITLRPGLSSDGWSGYTPFVQWTAPQTGRYNVSAWFGLVPGGNMSACAVTKNFSPWWQDLGRGYVGSGTDWTYNNPYINMNAGDTLEFYGGMYPLLWDWYWRFHYGDANWWNRRVMADIKIKPADTPTFTAIPDARALPDGTPVNCSGAIVTGQFGSFLYMETPDRLCGIRVALPVAHGTAWSGYDVTVTGGIMATDPVTGERYIDATAGTVNGEPGTTVIKPLSMTNITLGGGLGAQPGVLGGVGLNNVGLLVRTTGRVSNPLESATEFTVDDGSAVNVRVICPSGAPADGKFVIVTGISTLFGTDKQRLIRVESASTDIVEIPM